MIDEGKDVPAAFRATTKKLKIEFFSSFNSFIFGKIYKMREQVLQKKEIPVFSANFKAGYLDHRHRGVQLLK